MTPDELKAQIAEIRERDAAVSPYLSGFGAERDRRNLLSHIDEQDKRIALLESKLSEAEKDAERYRWLRKTPHWIHSAPPMRAVTYQWRNWHQDGDLLDASIDAAMLPKETT